MVQPWISHHTGASLGARCDLFSVFLSQSEYHRPMRGAVPTLLAWASLCAACEVQLGSTPGNPDGTPADPDAGGNGPDAAVDAAPLGAWGRPQAVPGASTGAIEDDGSLSSNALEMVFAVVDPAANNTKDLYYMSRPSPTGPWSARQKLPFNTTLSDETPRFSPDDLTLYFASGRAGGPGGLDIYRVTRNMAGPTGTWGTPQLVPGVSTTGTDKWFMPCAADNTYLTIVGNDIGEGTLGNPPTVNAVLSSTTGTETGTFLSKDCLTVYFASTRSGTNMIYTSTRPALGAQWSAPALVADFQQIGGAQEDPWVSSDLRTFVLVSDIGGTKDVYISTR